MPNPAERLALLLEVYGDSYRSAGQLCDLDHTTLMRVGRGESENPATMAKIAEGYGVPVDWFRGERDLDTDFAFAVLRRPLRDRVLFLWQPDRRTWFALQFLLTHDRFTMAQLAELLQVGEPTIESFLRLEKAPLTAARIDDLCRQTGLPLDWFQTGMVGREDEEELLAGMAEWALASLAEAMGLTVTQDEIHAAALALV